MKTLFTAAALAIATLAVAACQSTGSRTEAVRPSPEQAMIAAGRQVFDRCKACHSEKPGQNTFGPQLQGVVGRRAGSLPRFSYSQEMANSDLVWTEDNLRRWISDNTLVMPLTRMRHVSITDPAEQDYLIAFLRSLR